jgi:hypothetical protein
MARRLNQAFCWNAEHLVELPHHGQSQVAFPIKYLLDTVALTDRRFQILNGKALLIHTKLDSFNWIRQVDRELMSLFPNMLALGYLALMS